MWNTSGRDIKAAETAELRRQALELRRQRLAYGAIAEKMGISRSRAHQLVHEAIAEIPKDEAKDVLAMELADLEADEIVANAIAVDVKEAAADRLKAIATKLKIKERRAKYLGLDAPTKTELSGEVSVASEPTVADAARLVREAFGATTPSEPAGDAEPTGSAAGSGAEGA